VEALFARHCAVKRVVMKPAGYCFVWTGAVDQAIAAKEALHNRPFMGMSLQAREPL
jgi:RNA recognition motif-containing protein